MADIGITKKLDTIIEKLEEQEKPKEKKFKVKMSKGKLKKNYVLVILLRTNSELVIRYLPIEDEMIYIKENQTFHMSNAKYIWKYKNYPVILLPEWDLEPISREKLIRSTEESNSWALPQKVIINAMKLAQMNPKKSGLGGNKILWLIIGISVVLYLLYQMLTQ